MIYSWIYPSIEDQSEQQELVNAILRLADERLELVSLKNLKKCYFERKFMGENIAIITGFNYYNFCCCYCSYYFLLLNLRLEKDLKLVINVIP